MSIDPDPSMEFVVVDSLNKFRVFFFQIDEQILFFLLINR